MQSRYQRQTVLPEIGPEGQNKIASASVLCIGAGGLGCPALIYLAGAGVGNIGIVDFDTIDESNLQRQTLFSMDQVGQNKAEAARTKLLDLNPEISIATYTSKLTASNAEEIIRPYDIIIDGTDNFATKFLLNDAAVKFSKPLIYASILGFEGQLSVFDAEHGACYRCLFPTPPQGHIPNCAEAGIIGALAGIIGSAQAMEAIKLIVGHPSLEPLISKLWMLDARTMRSRTINLLKDPECPTCSLPIHEIKLQSDEISCTVIKEISPGQATAYTNALYIDVRELDEWNNGHIENALHIPLSSLMQGQIPDLPKNKNMVLYCHKGMRSLYAAQILQSAGYKDLYNLRGGFEAWLTA